jgi:hypothetical protein
MASGLAHVVVVPTKARSGLLELTLHADKTEDGTPIAYPAHAVFAGDGQHVVAGAAAGSLLIWERSAGKLVAGLDYPEGKVLVMLVKLASDLFSAGEVQAVANRPDWMDKHGCLVTATKGKLTWWPQPELSGESCSPGFQSPPHIPIDVSAAKRAKHE